MEKGIHIRFEKKFPYLKAESISDPFNALAGKEKPFKVSLGIPVEDGWTASSVSWRGSTHLAQIEFTKPGEEPRYSRLKDGWFIDEAPVKQEPGDAFSLGGFGPVVVMGGTVADKIHTAMSDRLHKGIKLTWNF